MKRIGLVTLCGIAAGWSCTGCLSTAFLAMSIANELERPLRDRAKNKRVDEAALCIEADPSFVLDESVPSAACLAVLANPDIRFDERTLLALAEQICSDRRFEHDDQTVLRRLVVRPELTEAGLRALDAPLLLYSSGEHGRYDVIASYVSNPKTPLGIVEAYSDLPWYGKLDEEDMRTDEQLVALKRYARRCLARRQAAGEKLVRRELLPVEAFLVRLLESPQRIPEELEADEPIGDWRITDDGCGFIRTFPEGSEAFAGNGYAFAVRHLLCVARQDAAADWRRAAPVCELTLEFADENQAHEFLRELIPLYGLMGKIEPIRLYYRPDVRRSRGYLVTREPGGSAGSVVMKFKASNRYW